MKNVFLWFIYKVDSEEEHEILAVVEDDDEDAEYNNGDKASLQSPQKLLQIVPTTRLTFLSRQYRLVYCIDMSPSMAMVVSFLKKAK